MSGKLIEELTDESFQKVLEKGLLLVDFHAVWCGPCRMLAPIIEEVAEEFNGKVKVVKIDIDKEQKSAAQFQVTSVPTLVLIKDGKEIDRLIGLRDVSSIKKFVSKAV